MNCFEAAEYEIIPTEKLHLRTMHALDLTLCVIHEMMDWHLEMNYQEYSYYKGAVAWPRRSCTGSILDYVLFEFHIK